MRLSLLVSSLSRHGGGVFEAVRRLGQCLQGQGGVQVEVLGLRDDRTDVDGPLWFPLQPRGFACRGPAGFGYAPALATELQKLSPDLVHLHGLWMYPSVAARAWSRRTRRPHVVTPHGMLDTWALANSRWKKRLAGWLFEDGNLRSAACLHALCESEAQCIRAYGLKNPIAIIPNGIDLPNVSEAQSAECKAQSERMALGNSRLPPGAWRIADLRANGRKVLLYLGRLHPKKGLVNLLRAWSKVQGAGSSTLGASRSALGAPEWVLAIAGWDQNGHESELKRLATELGIQWEDCRAQSAEGKAPDAYRLPLTASLIFLGPLFGSAKETAYRSCDAFILPSFSEGLPMVVLEAWAYGKPVLMTPECNLPEGFAAGAAIRIAPSAESIAQGLKELFETSDSSRLALGAKGRTLVASRFAWPQIAREMHDVYDWVLATRPKPECVVER